MRKRKPEVWRLRLLDANAVDAIDIFEDDYLAKIEKIKLPNTKSKLLQQLLLAHFNAWHIPMPGTSVGAF